MSVHAPFNFIPLSDQVYIPSWAEQISHDVPFSDGVSGKIRLTITAESDIFVRNGQSKNAVDNRFSQVSGRYFIPATSIKGEVRNLMEIMSFGKMNLDTRAKFAQREWNNPNLYTIKDPNVQREIRCGYLRKKGDDYEIVDHGRPLRISHEAIDAKLGGGLLRKHFSGDSHFNINKTKEMDGQTFDPKTAAFKYHLFKGKVLENLSFTEVRTNTFTYVTCADRGEFTGDIVFTGSPDKWGEERGMNAGKFYEFVFPSKVEGCYRLSEKEFEHYEFIYKDSDDWNYWKSHLTDTDKGVPVFFRTEDNQIKDFGLALLYKLPYDKTPYDLLPKAHREEATHDLAECIFGYTTGRTDSLRGRVQFSNAFSTNAKPRERKVTLVLGTPKASYYPIYIEQTGSNGRTGKYKTYNDGRLAGWKRYHVRKGVWQKDLGNKNLDSKLTPVGSGATFTGDIVFHNLRPIELGALLSALTFHGNPNGYYHLLGQAKPYGYGRCRYSVTLEGEGLKEPNYYMGHFEHELSDKLGTPWHQSPQIQELFALAGSSVSNATDQYKYMDMSNNPSENEFQLAKGGRNGRGDKYYLPRFSELFPEHASGPNSLSEGIEKEIKAQQLVAVRAEYEQRLAELDNLSLEEAIRQTEEVLTRLNEKMAHRMDGDINALYKEFRETFEARKTALEEEIKARKLAMVRAEYKQCLAELDSLSLEEAIRQAEEVLTRLNEKMAHRMDGDIYALYQGFKDSFETKKSALEDLQRQQAEEEARAEESAALYEAGLGARLNPKYSLKANLNRIKKWLKVIQEQEGRNELNEEEVKLITQFFQEVYNLADGRVNATVATVLGQDLADRIFGLLNLE